MKWYDWTQITYRLADVAGLFLLISFLGWLRCYKAEMLVLPALAVTLTHWLVDRIHSTGELHCG